MKNALPNTLDLVEIAEFIKTTYKSILIKYMILLIQAFLC